MAEFEKWKNPPKANFVISKRATTEDGVCMDLFTKYYIILKLLIMLQLQYIQCSRFAIRQWPLYFVRGAY